MRTQCPAHIMIVVSHHVTLAGSLKKKRSRVRRCRAQQLRRMRLILSLHALIALSPLAFDAQATDDNRAEWSSHGDHRNEILANRHDDDAITNLHHTTAHHLAQSEGSGIPPHQLSVSTYTGMQDSVPPESPGAPSLTSIQVDDSRGQGTPGATSQHDVRFGPNVEDHSRPLESAFGHGGRAGDAGSAGNVGNVAGLRQHTSAARSSGTSHRTDGSTPYVGLTDFTDVRYPLYDYRPGPNNPWEVKLRNPKTWGRSKEARTTDEDFWKKLREEADSHQQFVKVLSHWEKAEYPKGVLLDRIDKGAFVENTEYFNKRFHGLSTKEKFRHQEAGRWILHIKQREWIWLDAIKRLEGELKTERTKPHRQRSKDQVYRLEAFLDICKRRLEELRSDISRLGMLFHWHSKSTTTIWLFDLRFTDAERLGSKGFLPPPFVDSRLGRTLLGAAALSAPLAAAGLVSTNAISANNSRRTAQVTTVSQGTMIPSDQNPRKNSSPQSAPPAPARSERAPVTTAYKKGGSVPADQRREAAVPPSIPPKLRKRDAFLLRNGAKRRAQSVPFR